MSVADPATMDNTLQMRAPQELAATGAAGVTGKRVRAVGIVEGSRPGLSSLTDTLLAERLRTLIGAKKELV